MRTIKIILLVAALGTATLVWTLSGAGGIYGTTDPISGMQSGEELEDASNESTVNESEDLEGSARGEDNLVGLIISGTSSVVTIAKMVALLPVELQRLGFPFWFAVPIGVVTQFIVGIGVFQFASGRVWR